MVRFWKAEAVLAFAFDSPVTALPYHAATRSRVPCRRLVHLPSLPSLSVETAKRQVVGRRYLRHEGVGAADPNAARGLPTDSAIVAPPTAPITRLARLSS